MPASHSPHDHGNVHPHAHGDGMDEHHEVGFLGAIRHLVALHSHDHAAAIDSATANREGMRRWSSTWSGCWPPRWSRWWSSPCRVRWLSWPTPCTTFGCSHRAASGRRVLARSPTREPPYTYGYGSRGPRWDLHRGHDRPVRRPGRLAGGGGSSTRRPSSTPAWVAAAGLSASPATSWSPCTASGSVAASGRPRWSPTGSRPHRRAHLPGRHRGGRGVDGRLGAGRPIVGLVISVAILNVLRHAARDIYRRLMDRVDPASSTGARARHTTGIVDVDRVPVRWIGHGLHADAEVALDPTLELAAAHDVREEARHRLLHNVPRLADVLLHANPAGRPQAHDRTSHHRQPPVT